MAGITGTDVNTANRRMASVAGHLIPDQTRPGNGMALSNCSSGPNDSYHRAHGEVPTHGPQWKRCNDSGKEFTDIIYEKAVGEGIAKISINRPERRNAATAHTMKELMRAFKDARDDNSIGVIILTGKGTQAFCSGGDLASRGKHGYTDHDGFDRLDIIDLQVQIRRLPKPVIAMVAGYAIAGGQVLHMMCDITIAAENAVFGQIESKMGSFDAGFGASIMDRLIGPKKAREMWFLGRFYKADEAEKMGLVNVVVPLEKLEEETVKWCREIMRNSPMAIRVMKSALNAVDDGHSGLQQIAGDELLLFYGTEEGSEGKNAYLQRRKPDFSKFPRLP